MAFALVTNVLAHGGAAPTSAAVDTTGANLIVGIVSGYAVTPNLSDIKGNTYTSIASVTSGSVISRLVACYSPTVGSGHTFSAVAGSNYITLAVAAFSGAAASPLDVSNSAIAASASTIQPGSITPTAANELVICGAGTDGGSAFSSINGGFTITDSQPNAGAEEGAALAYLIQTSATAANPTWTMAGASNLLAIIASFKAPAPPPTGGPMLVPFGSRGLKGLATAAVVGAVLANPTLSRRQLLGGGDD